MKSHLKFAILLSAACLLAAPAIADSTLQVNGSAALEGSFGLEVCADGTATDAFVRDTTPNNETVYRAAFKFNMNDMAFGFGARHLIFSAATNSANGSRTIEIQIRRTPSDTFDLRALNMVTGTSQDRKRTPVIPITSNGTHDILLEWMPASAPGVEDGFVRLTVDGGAPAQVNVRNFTQNVRAQTLGLQGSSVDAGTVGCHYFDSFQSFRTLAAP